jgi:ABC-type cobalamin/Fe3+-siderophores transport system ATPase subunit
VEPGGRLTLDTDRESMARQLVTTYGLPLLIHSTKALVLHACSAVPPNHSDAVLVCGSSGTGKSTLLVALIAAGWQAVSEDLCVVDTHEARPRVWPGPPWVRRDGEGPDQSRPRFHTAEKTAWDIAPWQVTEPVPIGRVVFLEPPGGDSITRFPVDRAASVASLARMTAWLSESSLRAAATFAPSVELAGAAQAQRLRFPVSDDWTTKAEEVLRAS